MRYPDQWLHEYEDYKVEYFRNNNNIYDRLTDSQMQVIKTYFRWRTRERYLKFGGNSGALKVNPDKAAKLVNILGGADDWTYDGCVDLGFKGAGHCELGHALRYEHYAYSASLNKSVIFGVNCVSDFFGLSQDLISRMKYVQDEILEEVKLIVFIMNTGKTQEHIDRYYKDLPNVVNILRDRMDETFGRSWNEMMGSFIENRLPFTKTLINRFEWVKRTYINDQVQQVAVIDRLKQEFKGNDMITRFLNIAHTSNKHYTRIALNYTDRKLRQNIGSLPAFDVIYLATVFESACYKLKSLGVKSVVNFAKAREVSSVYVQTFDEATGAPLHRIATAQERADMSSNAYIHIDYTTEDEYVEYMKCLEWACTGDMNLYRKLNVGKQGFSSEDAQVHEVHQLMRKLLKWIGGNDFEVDLRKISTSYKKLVALRETAQGGSQEPNDEIVDIIAFIYTNCPKDSDKYIYKAALDISTKYTKYKINLSDKQKALLRSAYDSLVNQIEREQKGARVAHDNISDLDIGALSESQVEALDMASYIKSHAELSAYSKLFNKSYLNGYLKLGLDVSETVLKNPTREASEKQIRILKGTIKHLGDIKQKMDTTESSDRQSGENVALGALGKNSQSKILNIDDQENTQSWKGAMEDMRGIDPTSGNNEKPKDTYLQFPSILDISDALGIGLFKETFEASIKLST